jgi:hypothetical protein
MAVKKIEVVAEPAKRKTLQELFNEPCTVAIDNAQMHQAFMLPGAGTESSIHPGRAGLRDIKMVYHPGYGLIILNKGKYTLVPNCANMIMGTGA